MRERLEQLDHDEFIEELGNQYMDFAFASLAKPINRYSVRVGKIYGGASDRFKIMKLSGDTVFYKDIASGKVYYKDVDALLKEWSNKGIKEIAFVDELLDIIRTYLEPILGPILLAGLISWVYSKVK